MDRDDARSKSTCGGAPMPPLVRSTAEFPLDAFRRAAGRRDHRIRRRPGRHADDGTRDSRMGARSPLVVLDGRRNSVSASRSARAPGAQPARGLPWSGLIAATRRGLLLVATIVSCAVMHVASTRLARIMKIDMTDSMPLVFLTCSVDRSAAHCRCSSTRGCLARWLGERVSRNRIVCERSGTSAQICRGDRRPRDPRERGRNRRRRSRFLRTVRLTVSLGAAVSFHARR